MAKKKAKKTGVKRGALSKSEKFYIAHNPDELGILEMSKELNRSEKQVAEEAVKHEVKEEKKLANPQKPETMFQKTMGTHINKITEKPTASVMTKAASEHADEARKTNKTGVSSKTSGSIFEPRGRNWQPERR